MLLLCPDNKKLLLKKIEIEFLPSKILLIRSAAEVLAKKIKGALPGQFGGRGVVTGRGSIVVKGMVNTFVNK